MARFQLQNPAVHDETFYSSSFSVAFRCEMFLVQQFNLSAHETPLKSPAVYNQVDFARDPQ